MTRDRQLRRDLAIALEAIGGRPQREIATRYGICTRTVRRAIGRAQQLADGNYSKETLESLDKRWTELTASIEDLGIARIEAQNPRTLIAAISKQSKLMHARSKLQIACARIDPARDRQRIALAQEFADQLLAAARRDGLARETRIWLATATSRLVA